MFAWSQTIYYMYPPLTPLVQVWFGTCYIMTTSMEHGPTWVAPRFHPITVIFINFILCCYKICITKKNDLQISDLQNSDLQNSWPRHRRCHFLIKKVKFSFFGKNTKFVIFRTKNTRKGAKFRKFFAAAPTGTAGTTPFQL